MVLLNLLNPKYNYEIRSKKYIIIFENLVSSFIKCYSYQQGHMNNKKIEQQGLKMKSRGIYTVKMENKIDTSYIQFKVVMQNEYITILFLTLQFARDGEY